MRSRRGGDASARGAADGGLTLTGANLSAMTDSYSSEALHAMTTGTLLERMGIVITEVSPSRVVGTMPVAGNTQPYGLLHGGANVVLAESLGSMGAMAHAGEGRMAVGIEVSASHHRSARSGVVTGTATALHLGRSSATYEIVVLDSESRRLATARLTCMLIDSRPGA